MSLQDIHKRNEQFTSKTVILRGRSLEKKYLPYLDTCVVGSRSMKGGLLWGQGSEGPSDSLH